MKKLRTQKEMVDKIREMKKEDMFGCWTGDLVTYLSFDNSKEFINPVDSEKRYEKFHREYTEENVTAEMKSYLKFAWEKANGQRGLSANRSLIHY